MLAQAVLTTYLLGQTSYLSQSDTLRDGIPTKLKGIKEISDSIRILHLNKKEEITN